MKASQNMLSTLFVSSLYAIKNRGNLRYSQLIPNNSYFEVGVNPPNTYVKIDLRLPLQHVLKCVWKLWVVQKF